MQTLIALMHACPQSGFQCPTCKKVYGVKTGDMPDGTMTVKTQNYSLPGHEGYDTFEITYDFRPGVHVSTHDSNGRSAVLCMQIVLLLYLRVDSWNLDKVCTKDLLCSEQ